MDTRIIQTAVSGAENYVEAGEEENETLQNTVDYLDSVVASIKEEDTSGGSSSTGTDLSTLTETERLALVGQYVDYTPDSGIYSTVTKSSTYTGTTENDTDFTTDTTLNWQIWSITDDTLTLISNTTAQSGGCYYDKSSYGYCLYLYGALGYNNAVYLLNEICNTLYSNLELGAKGRSLDIVDIEAVLAWNYWAPTSQNTSTYYYTYNMSTTYQYANSDYKSSYPVIWKEEDFSNINGEKIEASCTYDSETGIMSYTGNGLRRNEQIKPYTGTYNTASEYIETTRTYWTGANGSSYYENSKYYSLVNCGMYYWLASRFVNPYSYYALFRCSVCRQRRYIWHEISVL